MVLPKRRAFHVIHEKSLEKALRYAAMNNWTGIVPDINVPRFSPEKIDKNERTLLANLSEELQIEWGFHSPADNVNLFSSYPTIRTAIIEYIKQIIDLARNLSPTKTNLVIHAGHFPNFRNAGGHEDTFLKEHYELYLGILCENILEMIDYGKPDVTIELENQRWNELIREAISKLTTKGLRLCLDVPKLYTPDLELKMDDWNLFSSNPELIDVVHVHDMARDGKSHQTVGEGDIDFTPILQFLRKKTQDIQYVFEIRPKEAAQTSLVRFEDILREIS